MPKLLRNKSLYFKNKIISIVMILSFLLLLAACSSIKEYTGVRITRLTYNTIDYMSGYTYEHNLDFNENTYSHIIGNVSEETINIFTDEEEKVFIDSCYTYGLFSLKELYGTSGIVDGGGWSLIIEYEDGTIKASKGDNEYPEEVFNRCSTIFYDICRCEVMGELPKYYSYPPNISYALSFDTGDSSVSTNEIVTVVRGNYKWNNDEVNNNDYFRINEDNELKNNLSRDYSYELILYTANYDCDEKFDRITVKEYDYNSDLTNEKDIYTGKWIKQIELDITINKIYVYELSFKDGDYVQYTFSTYCY